jgi:hypothetical protein
VQENNTLEQAKKDQAAGKSPSTQAGRVLLEKRCTTFAKASMVLVTTQQATAIGLSKAPRAGITLAAPKKGKTSAEVRREVAARSPQGAGRPLSAMLARGLSRTQAGTINDKRRSRSKARKTESGIGSRS